MTKPRVVIDTNVIISAMRSNKGASALLLSFAGTERFSMHLSVPLALEYEEVLLRQKRSIGLNEEEIGKLVDALCAVAEHHEIHFLWRPSLRDIDDEAVLELAVAAGCRFIITYNKRDFAGSEKFGVEPLTPKEFLKWIGEI